MSALSTPSSLGLLRRLKGNSARHVGCACNFDRLILAVVFGLVIDAENRIAEGDKLAPVRLARRQLPQRA